jgi:Mn-containing catalase
MLLNTATEEMGHIEMPATAVALNLEKVPLSLQETAAANPVINAVMGGERPRHMVECMLHKRPLSTGLAAHPSDSDGVPFDCSHVYASGNLAADMFANVAAESTGRVLAVCPADSQQLRPESGEAGVQLRLCRYQQERRATSRRPRHRYFDRTGRGT